MKSKLKNNTRVRLKQFLLIGGILTILVLMSSQNLVMLPGNSPSTNSVLPNNASSQVPTLSVLAPNPSPTGVINLSWSNVSSAISYNVYECSTPMSESSILYSSYDNEYSASSTNFSIQEPNGNYYFVVTALNSSYAESNCSNCVEATVAASPPATPVLAPFNPNPSNSTENKVSWSAVNNTLTYDIYVDSVPINSSIIGQLSPTEYISAPQTSWMYSMDSNGTSYFVVEASNQGGSSGPSNCESLTLILHPPSAPTLSVITPNPNLLGNITLFWSAVSGAQFYNIYESTSPLTEANITNTQYNSWFTVWTTTYTDDEPNGTYYYVVSAYNGVGDSICSNCQPVTVTATTPTAPSLTAISPNPCYSTQISLSWSKVNNALSYNIYMSNSPITSGNIGSLTSIMSVNAPQTSWTDTETTNGTYYYAVEAINEGGISAPSNYQSVLMIRDFPVAPILSTISPNPNPLGKVKLSWSPVNGAQNYTLYENGSPLTETDITNNQFATSTQLLSTTYTEIMPNGTYYFVVTAINSTGQSNCSNCQSVTVAASAPAAPILATISPNPSTSHLITLSWNAISNAINYSVYMSKSPITSGNIGSLTSIESINAPQTSWTDSEYTNGTYYYAVVATNGVGSSNSSNCQSVNVAITPVPISPANLAITPNPSTDGKVTLQWSASNDATSYMIYRYTSPITEINSSVTFVATTSTTKYNDTLNASGTYYYVVVASNSAGNSPISNCKSVVVTIQSSKSILGFPLSIFLGISTLAVVTVFLRKKHQFITA